MNMFKIQKIYFDLYENLKKWQIQKFVRKQAAGYCDPKFKLTKEQEKQVKEFYAPYIKGMPVLFHEFYTQKTGVFSPKHLPIFI